MQRLLRPVVTPAKRSATVRNCVQSQCFILNPILSLGFLRNARAIAILCLWPPDNWEPCSPTLLAYLQNGFVICQLFPFGDYLGKCGLTLLEALKWIHEHWPEWPPLLPPPYLPLQNNSSQSSQSSPDTKDHTRTTAYLPGLESAIFSYIVPSKSVGSCDTSATWVLHQLSCNDLRSCSSIKILQKDELSRISNADGDYVHSKPSSGNEALPRRRLDRKIAQEAVSPYSFRCRSHRRVQQFCLKRNIWDWVNVVC